MQFEWIEDPSGMHFTECSFQRYLQFGLFKYSDRDPKKVYNYYVINKPNMYSGPDEGFGKTLDECKEKVQKLFWKNRVAILQDVQRDIEMLEEIKLEVIS